MRSWDKYCEDTEKAFKHFRDCIWQPVYIVGYVGANSCGKRFGNCKGGNNYVRRKLFI